MLLDTVHFVWGEEITLIVRKWEIRDGGQKLYRELVDKGQVASDRRVAEIEILDEYTNGNALVVMCLHII